MHDHSNIKEHMKVVGADGVHVGTVDHLDDTGERIKLTKGRQPVDRGRTRRQASLPAGRARCLDRGRYGPPERHRGERAGHVRNRRMR